jgi:hypothetical protein
LGLRETLKLSRVLLDFAVRPRKEERCKGSGAVEERRSRRSWLLNVNIIF